MVHSYTSSSYTYAK